MVKNHWAVCLFFFFFNFSSQIRGLQLDKPCIMQAGERSLEESDRMNLHPGGGRGIAAEDPDMGPAGPVTGGE